MVCTNIRLQRGGDLEDGQATRTGEYREVGKIR